MLEKNILDRIVKFFKSIGTKEASGEPIDLGRHRHDSDSEEKQIRIHHDVEIKSEAPAAASEPMIKVVHEDNEKSEPQKEQTHNAVVVAKVHPRREYSQALEILRNRYPWRKLKAEKALSVQDLPEPFYFLTSDNQPVEASKFEVSFVKELLAKAAEAGIENKFFNNRLGMEFNFYYNDIKDQILSTTSAASMGAQSMLMNVGELSNKGVELNVYGTPFENKDWRWDLRANVAWNKNTVKKLADGLDVLKHFGTDGDAAVLESHVGESMGDWYTYTWKTDDKGNYIVGSNGLYIADKTERHKVGNAMPKFTGGFGTSLSYKNFTLDMSFDFRIGGDVLNLPWQYMMDAGNITDAVGVRDYSTGGVFYYSDTEDVSDKASIHVLSAAEAAQVAATYKRGDKYNGHYLWDNGLILPGVKEDGTPNDIVVTQFEANDNMYGWGTGASQSYADAIQKNTYVKCREISLAYTLPTSITKKFACNRLTISGFVRNPFYIYRTLKLFDSETSDATNWIYQAQVGGSTASALTFGFSLRASF